MIIHAMKAKQSGAVPGVVSTTYVRLLYEYLQQRGFDPEQLLAAPAPDAADLGLGRFPMLRWRELLDKAVDALDDPLLGLHLGQSITPAHLGTVGYVLLACANLAEACPPFQLNGIRPYPHLHGFGVVNQTHVLLNAGESLGQIGAGQ